MLRHKQGPHFGWFVFATMSMYSFTIYNVAFNSIFALPLANALGVTRGTLLVYTSFYSIAGMSSSFLYGFLLSNKKVPLRLLTVGGLLAAEVAYLLFAFGNHLWMIYLAGFLLGIPLQGCNIMTAQVMAANWYSARVRGKLLSMQNSFRGLGSIAWPILLQLIIDSHGYQFGYFTLMAILIPPIIMSFFLKRSPDEMGLKPLGHREGAGQWDNASYSELDDPNIGWNLRHALKTPAFWFLILTVVCIGMQNGFTSNYTGIAQEFLDNAENFAMIGALMVSIQSGFDMIGNFSIGFIVDKIGPVKTTIIYYFIVSGFFLIVLLFGRGNEIALLLASICFGFDSSMLRNSLPLATRQLFGAKFFGEIWGVCNMVKPMVSGLAITCIALSYDILGSYVGSLMYGFTMCMLGILFFSVAAMFIGRYDVKNTTD